jgi:hypothetical protein
MKILRLILVRVLTNINHNRTGSNPVTTYYLFFNNVKTNNNGKETNCYATGN